MNGDSRTSLPTESAHPHLPTESAHPQPTAPMAWLAQYEPIDTLLRHATDSKDPGFVHYGRLRVEASIAPDFEKAERHRARDPEAVRLLGQFVHDPHGHTLHAIDASDPLGNGFQPHGTYDPAHPVQNGGEIFWDSHGAIRSNNGTGQSPALALLYEEGHAWDCKTDARGYLAGFGYKNRRDDTAEEQQNRQGLETRAAHRLGEGTRSDHGGFPTPSTARRHARRSSRASHTIDRSANGRLHVGRGDGQVFDVDRSRRPESRYDPPDDHRRARANERRRTRPRLGHS